MKDKQYGQSIAMLEQHCEEMVRAWEAAALLHGSPLLFTGNVSSKEKRELDAACREFAKLARGL